MRRENRASMNIALVLQLAHSSFGPRARARVLRARVCVPISRLSISASAPSFFARANGLIAFAPGKEILLGIRVYIISAVALLSRRSFCARRRCAAAERDCPAVLRLAVRFRGRNGILRIRSLWDGNFERVFVLRNGFYTRHGIILRWC